MVALVLVVALLLVIPSAPPTLAEEIKPDRRELTESATLVRGRLDGPTRAA